MRVSFSSLIFSSSVSCVDFVFVVFAAGGKVFSVPAGPVLSALCSLALSFFCPPITPILPRGFLFVGGCGCGCGPGPGSRV